MIAKHGACWSREQVRLTRVQCKCESYAVHILQMFCESITWRGARARASSGAVSGMVEVLSTELYSSPGRLLAAQEVECLARAPSGYWKSAS